MSSGPRSSPVAAAGCVVLALACGAADPPGGVSRIGSDTVAVAAVVTAGRFEREILGMPGYHLAVWEDGKAAPAALFRAKASDVQVLEALEALGARPGNGLGMETWERRDDPAAAAPKRVIRGPAVEVLVRVPGPGSHSRRPLALGDFLTDPGGRGFDMRFGGHRANIPHWHSGCLVCLYSCPGSKVGNARYTVRDYVDGTTRFRVRPGVLPADGTEVTLLFRLLPQRFPGGSGAGASRLPG